MFFNETLGIRTAGENQIDFDMPQMTQNFDMGFIAVQLRDQQVGLFEKSDLIDFCQRRRNDGTGVFVDTGKPLFHCLFALSHISKEGGVS